METKNNLDELMTDIRLSLAELQCRVATLPDTLALVALLLLPDLRRFGREGDAV